MLHYLIFFYNEIFMKKPTEQPDTDLAELHDKVARLKKAVQTKKEERYRKKEETAATAKEAEEEKRLKDSFNNGADFVTWMQELRDYDYTYTINIDGRHKTSILSGQISVENPNNRVSRHQAAKKEWIGGYIEFLQTLFKTLQDQFKKRKNVIDDPKRGIKVVSVPSKCRVFPGSGTVINDCCGGVNGHERGCGAKNLQEFPLGADELEALRKKQDKELEELTEEIAREVKSIHAHMEGFIETILKLNPDPDAILYAVKVAMVAGADTFCRFGGRQKVLRHLQTTVIDKIEAKLSTGGDIDEKGIEEIERILNGVSEAVKQQVK